MGARGRASGARGLPGVRGRRHSSRLAGRACCATPSNCTRPATWRARSREYRAYLKQAPNNVMARSNLGAALSKAGQYEEAIAEYQQALELEPRNLPVRVNLGLAYYKTAQISAAAEELAKVVQAAAVQPAGRLPAGRLRPAAGREQEGDRAALAAGKGIARTTRR